jgi:transcriptional regulator with XRE-family HTH domain
MEISLAGSIRTPYGEVELIPQDRSLLQASSPEPLRCGDRKIELWALFEQTGGTWAVSEIAAPVLCLTGRAVLTSSRLRESLQATILTTIAALAGEWARAHPEAFACAAAEAFEFDREGLHRELGKLREALTSSAHAIESIRSLASPEGGIRLRECWQWMRKMAAEVPAMHEIARTVAYPEERSRLPLELLRLTFDAPTVGSKSSDRREASSEGVATLGQVLKSRREKSGRSQHELAAKLGIAADDVANLESERGARPSFPLLSRAAELLGLEKDRLFGLADTRMNSVAGAGKVIPHGKGNGTVWSTFARDRALLDRYHIKPHELRALAQVSLMGKATDTEALLFILEAMSKADHDTDGNDDE